jgi:cytochrome c553
MNGKFYLPAVRGVFNAATSISLPDKVLEKQKADGSLLCFTCHAGRTDIFTKKDDFTAQSYGISAHYAPSAGNAAGLLLPKIKDASNGLEARVNFDDTTTWSTHAGLSGGEFPKCAECHDINENGHSLAAYKDSGGKPLITEILTDIDGISSVYTCGGCHGAEGSESVPILQAITSAKASADLLEFYGNALKIPEINLRFSQERLGVEFSQGFEFWNGSEWLGDDTFPAAWSADEKGLKKFAVALTYDALIHDKGAYAHLGRDGLRKAFGEALAFIYQSKTGNGGNAAGFKIWLQNGGDSFIDSSGTLTGVGSGGLEFLCPEGVCAYDDWKSVSWLP